MSDRRAFMNDDALVFLQVLHERSRWQRVPQCLKVNVRLARLTIVARSFEYPHTLLDRSTRIPCIVRRSDCWEDGDVHAKRLVRHLARLAHGISESLGRRLRERSQDTCGHAGDEMMSDPADGRDTAVTHPNHLRSILLQQAAGRQP